MECAGTCKHASALAIGLIKKKMESNKGNNSMINSGTVEKKCWNKFMNLKFNILGDKANEHKPENVRPGRPAKQNQNLPLIKHAFRLQLEHFVVAHVNVCSFHLERNRQ